MSCNKYIINVLFVLVFTLPLYVFGQGGIQKRSIEEKETKFSLVSTDAEPRYLSLKTNSATVDELVGVPVWNIRILEQNPIPWYVRNDLLYYVSREYKFKGSYSLTIQSIDLSSVYGTKDSSITALVKLRNSSLGKYSLRNMHARKFNNDHLGSLFYDFTVRGNNEIVLMSYFEGQLCSHITLTRTDVLESCDCIDAILAPPFQIFESKGELYLFDSEGAFSSLIVYDDGQISQSAIPEDNNIGTENGNGNVLRIKN